MTAALKRSYKLTDAQRATIRVRLKAGGVSQRQLAEEYRVHPSSISSIAVRQPHAWASPWWEGADTLSWEDDVVAQAILEEAGRSLTLSEIGKLWGLTREAIRVIEARALRKLRGSPEAYAAFMALCELAAAEDSAHTLPATRNALRRMRM